MKNLNREHIIILITLIIVFLTGTAILIMQNNNKSMVYSNLSSNLTRDSENNLDGSTQKNNNNSLFEEEIEEIKIIVHVAGEVHFSGVCELSEDARVIDAVEAAGGATSRADLDGINLAARITDGQKIYVPSVLDTVNQSGTTTPNILSNSSGNYSNTSTSKININSASQSELESLTGIGPSKANSIINYREDNGGFNSIEDLTNVSGIGIKTLENIKNNITVRWYKWIDLYFLLL